MRTSVQPARLRHSCRKPICSKSSVTCWREGGLSVELSMSTGQAAPVPCASLANSSQRTSSPGTMNGLYGKPRGFRRLLSSGCPEGSCPMSPSSAQPGFRRRCVRTTGQTTLLAPQAWPGLSPRERSWPSQDQAVAEKVSRGTPSASGSAATSRSSSPSFCTRRAVKSCLIMSLHSAPSTSAKSSPNTAVKCCQFGTMRPPVRAFHRMWPGAGARAAAPHGPGAPLRPASLGSRPSVTSPMPEM
mmetsp:Transcript_100563/g.284960  ORF Transcript_100563/g.284960 Transcript_100563/m.284960 type:complete len:244 (-) Transcript_100563:58-789(-)